MNKRKLAPLALALPLGLLAAAPAYAQDDSQTYHANLTSLNDSGASGSATVTTSGNQITVTVNLTGALEEAPHAQHIHIGGENNCPDPSAAGEDGILSTTDGQPSYGGIKVSLTTEGDSSPESALAVERMPTGSYTYERTLDVSSDVMASLEDGVIVSHGIDTINPSGKYDGEPKSELEPSLPQEATAPNSCGALASVPTGGMAAGNGGAADDGVEAGLIGFGSALLAAAGGSLFVARRRRGEN